MAKEASAPGPRTVTIFAQKFNAMAAQEIERKFLVEGRNLSDLKEGAGSSARIRQAYLAVDDEREVRLRSFDDREFVLSVKSSGSLSREEREIELGPEQVEMLRPLMEHRALSKTRYNIPYQKLRIEMDVYNGELEGLVVAEVEFESEKAAAAFDKPDWLGRELTGDNRFKNKNLVGKSWVDIREYLNENS